MGFAPEHDAELPDADPFRLERHIQVQHHRVVGKLEAFNMKVMLGKADQVVAEIVGEFDEFGQLFQHALIEFSGLVAAMPASISAREPTLGRQNIDAFILLPSRHFLLI